MLRASKAGGQPALGAAGAAGGPVLLPPLPPLLLPPPLLPPLPPLLLPPRVQLLLL